MCATLRVMLQVLVWYVGLLTKRLFVRGSLDRCWYKINILLIVLFLNMSAAQTLEQNPQNQDSQNLEACRTIEQAQLEGELGAFTQQLFFEDVRTLNVPSIVLLHWQDLNIDAVIDQEVAAAAQRVQDEAGGIDKLISAWNPGKAEELAQQVATYAFTSERFQGALEDLSAAVATDITTNFEDAATLSTSGALICMQTFISGAYGDAVADIFGTEIATQTVAMDASDISGSGAGTNIRMRTVGGVSAIIAGYLARTVIRRVTVQVTRRITGNVIGRVLGRAGTSVAGAASTAVPVVGWAVGLGLITWDVIEGSRRGALPQIEQALSDDRTTARIRGEVAAIVVEDLPALVDEISADIAAEVFDDWQTFVENYDTLLTLAARNAQFAAFLEVTDDEDLYKLAGFTAPLTRRQVMLAVNDGRLRRALELPDSTITMIEDGQTLDTVLAWADATEGDIERVVNLDLHNRLQPDDLTNTQLATLLSAETGIARSLAAQTPADLDALLTHVPAVSLTRVVQAVPVEDLTLLAWYATRLEPNALDSLLFTWTENPNTVNRYDPRVTRTLITTSRDQSRAINMVVEPAGVFRAGQDLTAFLQGRISWQLVLLKYPNIQWVLAFVGLVLMGIIMTVFRPVWRVLRFALTPILWLLSMARRGLMALFSLGGNAGKRPAEQAPKSDTTVDDDAISTTEPATEPATDRAAPGDD